MQWNWRPLSLKCWHFVASEDSITKFKSQGLYTIKIKYWNASGSGRGSGFPPSLIPALRNIGILHYKKAKLCKHLEHSVHTSEMLLELQALYCDYCGEKVCSVPGWLAGVAADAQALNPIPTIKLTDRDDGKVHRPLQQQQYQLPASGLRENQKLWSGTFFLLRFNHDTVVFPF